MALAHWQRTFTDTAGNVQPSLSVEIRNESTGALAAIYSDSAGTTPKDNPFATDSFGYGDFYAADGRYRIIATGIDWRNEEVLTFENLQAAVDDAETFAQAAALNAGVYDDTTAGLAATSDGDYFSTPSPAGDEYLILYRNDAGVATEIDTYPNRQAITDIRTDLASTLNGEGASLVSMEGGPTVEEAVNNRVIRVSSRTEMKAYDAPAGYQFSLEEGGRSGIFVVKSGTPPSDPQEGIYVVLDNGNYAERVDVKQDEINPDWFGAAADYDGVSGTDNTNAFNAALSFGTGLKISTNGRYYFSSSINVNKDFKIVGSCFGKFADAESVSTLETDTDNFIIKTTADKLNLHIDGVRFSAPNCIDIRPTTIAQTGENKIFIGPKTIFSSDENDYGFAVLAGRSDFSEINGANFYGFKGFCAVRFGGNINDSGSGSYSNSYLATALTMKNVVMSRESLIGISLEMVNNVYILQPDIGAGATGRQIRAIDVGGKLYNQQARLSSKYANSGTFYNRAGSENGGPNAFNFLDSDFVGSGRFNSVTVSGGHIERGSGSAVVTAFGLPPQQFGRGFVCEYVDFQNTTAADCDFIEMEGVRVGRTFMNEFDGTSNGGTNGVVYSNCTNIRLFQDCLFSTAGSPTGEVYVDGGGNFATTTFPSFSGQINTLSRPALLGADVGDGAFDGDPLRIGTARIWQDSRGSVRRKNSNPGSSLDGAVFAEKITGEPATSSDSGLPGQWAYGSGYLYIYTGDGTSHSWRRILTEAF